MAWWIYKCNANVWGNWDHFFRNPTTHWGTTQEIAQLADLAPGDMVIAYQTDRNELVGVAKVKPFRKRGPYLELHLESIEEVRTKVRPLKATSEIAAIPALTSRARRTLHGMTPAEAKVLLREARKAKRESLKEGKAT